MRVLIVEDDLRMAGLIRRGLVKEGLAADVAGSGEEALVHTGAHAYDAIVLDVMLPGLNGFETCRRLREAGIWSPVLMLTARDSVEDRVAGLDTGADDYLVKPLRSPSCSPGSGRSRGAADPSDRIRSRSATCASTRRRARSGAATTGWT